MKQGLVDQFDSLADLRRYYEVLRSQGDIYPINALTYVVTDYHLMRTIFRQSEDFRTFDFGNRIRQLLQIDPVKYDFKDIQESMTNWLLFMDGPEHLAWKKRLMQRMYGLDLKAIIETEWENVATALDHRSTFDLMKDLCEPLVCRILASIIGIDPNHFYTLRQIEKKFMYAMVPSMTLDGLSQIKEAYHAFKTLHFTEWEKGTLLQARLLNTLLNDTSESDRNKVMSHLEFILTAGVETSILLLSESMVRLLTDLRSKANYFQQAETSSLLIDELIRMSAPASVVTRNAMRDLEVGGNKIPKGTILLMFISCANRDPRYFPFPDDVNPENMKMGHLSFGLGRHHCLGTELSKMEMNFILPAFMERFGYNATIMPETIKRSFYTPGIASAQIQLVGKDLL
jgi:cytochrome P450